MDENYDEYFAAEDEEEQLELAQAALDRGEDETALDLAEECLEANPLNVEALNLCAAARSRKCSVPAPTSRSACGSSR
jgi:hypothetical protein